MKNDAEQDIRRIRVAPNTVAYVENHKLIMEFAIPGAPTETIDVKILEDSVHLTAPARVGLVEDHQAVDAMVGIGNFLGSAEAETVCDAIPRIARLMALTIRFEGMLRDETIRDYAELARLGRVTRARITQIMKLRHLAPDIQEQILFLPRIRGLNERNLRFIVSRIDWREQRRMFQKIAGRNGAKQNKC
jgi:hypothetical protein